MTARVMDVALGRAVCWARERGLVTGRPIGRYVAIATMDRNGDHFSIHTYDRGEPVAAQRGTFRTSFGIGCAGNGFNPTSALLRLSAQQPFNALFPGLLYERLYRASR